MTGDKEFCKLPGSWDWTTLDSVADIYSGFGFPKHFQGKTEGDIPFFKVMDISKAFLKGSIYLRHADNYISSNECDDLKAKPLKEGTIVFAKIGEAIKLNRRAILAQDSLVDNNVMGLKTVSEGICNLFIFYFINTIKLGDYSRATTVPSLRKSDVETIPIPLAPFPEQHRIVARIEELFSRLDAGVEALRRARDQLQRYRHSVLRAAVEGRLTAKWREAHPEVEAATNAIAVNFGNSNSSAEKEPYEIPRSWIWTAFSNLLSEPLRNGHSAKVSPDGNGIRTLTLSAVTERDFSERNTKITIADSKRVKDLWLKCGDILIERSNTIDYVGLSAIYLGENGFSIFPDLLIRARVSESLALPAFAEIVLRTPFSRDYFKRKAQGISGNMPKIDQNTIAKLPFPLPPLMEQYRIISEFDRQMSISDQLYGVTQYNLNLSIRLRQSILQRAFQGQLVPQDPTDEPASLLLERIRAERINEAPRRGRKSKAQQARLTQ